MGNTLTAMAALDSSSEILQNMLRMSDYAGNTIELVATKVTKVTNSFSEISMESTKSSEKTVSSVNKIGESLGKLLPVTKLVKNAFQLGMEGIQIAARQMDQRSKFQTLLGNDEQGDQLYQFVGDRTKQSKVGWKQTQMADGVSEFLGVTKEIDQLQKLVTLSERLYSLKPSLGAGESVSAIKSMLGGDASKLEQYGITGMDVTEFSGMVDSGETTQAIDLMDERLQAFGATQASVDRYSESLTVKLAILGESFQSSLGNAMSTVLASVLPILQQFADNLEAGKYQPFFDLMAFGGMVIVQVMDFVAEHTGLATFAIGTIIAALTIFKIISFLTTTGLVSQATVTALAAKATWAFNTALSSNALIAFLGVLAVGIRLLMDFSSAAKKTGKVSASADLDFSTPKLESELEKTGLPKTALPVQITNHEPLTVKGNVAINEENLKYLLDVAERDYIAKFSTATVAPVVNAYFGDVHETADVNEMMNQMGRKLNEEVHLAAEGVYGV